MNWKENWDETTGLWAAKGPGHTPQTKHLEIIHPGPNAAVHLLAAAQQNALSEIPVEQVLTALHQMQWKKRDELYGCMTWYSEEEHPFDTNASFFTGLSLIVLRIGYFDQLNQSCQKLLDQILAGLDAWFGHAVAEATWHYPNKYMGDLVCKWLLMEIMEKADNDGFVAGHMQQAAKYWLEQHWGWGEHLSDGYSTVCLNELSVLLLLSRKLPEQVKKSYQMLAAELLAIEDAFDGGPRVPALRSYAFQKPKMHINYRDSILPRLKAGEEFGNMPVLGQLLHERGWHKTMPERREQPLDLTIPCFAGSIASAHVEQDIRLGSMSRFPIMNSAEHATWGLSWQCFPVAFSRGPSDWGFLQWETIDGGIRRAHPANGGPPAHIPKALSETIMPPVFGQTYSIQRGSDVLILRIMRHIPKSWECVTDRFRLLQTSATAEVTEQEGCSQLLLQYPERTLSVHCVTLTETLKPELNRTETGLDWNLTRTEKQGTLHEKRILVDLWAISLDGKIDTLPEISTVSQNQVPRSEEEKKRVLRWKWAKTHWQVLIDPLSDTPLLEISGLKTS